jgi:hypothetical protein
MHNDKTNNDLCITKFVKYLSQFSILHDYGEVPNRYYQSWKILVLGSSEYDSRAYNIIETAQIEWFMNDKK